MQFVNGYHEKYYWARTVERFKHYCLAYAYKNFCDIPQLPFFLRFFVENGHSLIPRA